jgi:hypothetical protein
MGFSSALPTANCILQLLRSSSIFSYPPLLQLATFGCGAAVAAVGLAIDGTVCAFGELGSYNYFFLFFAVFNMLSSPLSECAHRESV